MKLIYTSALVVLALSILLSCDTSRSNMRADISSPDGSITVSFILQDGVPNYMVSYDNAPVIEPSSLGFRFKEGPAMDKDFVVTGTTIDSANTTWKPVWGTSSEVRDHYHQLTVSLKEKTQPHRIMEIIFRAYNDGVAFRYILPTQPNLTNFEILDEETLFRFAGDNSAWWIPANWDSYEQLYTNTPVSQITAANTPVTMETGEGIFLSIHEADLIDYAGMTLAKVDSEAFTLRSALVPWPNDSVKVKASAPQQTPWRTIQITDDAAKLVESHLIQNLNPPNVLEDVSWIKPMKYVGIWWGMHIKKETWHQGPDHGATTQNAKRYIDFASTHHIGGLLVEGWNEGWEDWGNGNKFNFTKPYPDYDLKEVVRYAKEKGVSLIVHNETGSNVTDYISQMDSAFAFYQSLGLHAIKSGYVGPITPDGQHHHGQWMVNHYRDVVKNAARHQIMLDVHEPIKPTGESRTYPNMMTREGVRGTEYEAWSSGNPPEHTTILPFTRMLAGPLDYTPGIFDLTFNQYRKENRVHTTLAKQLALYVILFSPLQMAADLPENYVNQPAFTFIENVPVTWDETRGVNAQIGDYVTIARRNGEQWFLGSITDEDAREFELTPDFLTPGKQYVAHIYADGPGADWDTNPLPVSIDQYLADSQTLIRIVLAKGGGTAIRFSPATAEEAASLPPYPAGE